MVLYGGEWLTCWGVGLCTEEMHASGVFNLGFAAFLLSCAALQFNEWPFLVLFPFRFDNQCEKGPDLPLNPTNYSQHGKVLGPDLYGARLFPDLRAYQG